MLLRRRIGGTYCRRGWWIHEAKRWVSGKTRLSKPGETDALAFCKNVRRQLLRVAHPDVMADAPHEIRDINLVSMQRLQEILSFLEDEGSSLARNSDTVLSGTRDGPLRFFIRRSIEDDGTGASDWAEIRTEIRLGSLKSLPQGASSAFSVNRRVRSILEDALVDLAVQAGVLPPELAAEKSRMQEAQARRRGGFRKESENSPIPSVYKEVVDQLSANLVESAPSELAKLGMMIRPDMIFFDGLESAQESRSLRKLQQNLVKLGFERWYDLPMRISNAYTRTPPGFVCFPYNFDVDQLAYYLKQNLPDIRAEWEEKRAVVRKIVQLQGYLRQELGAESLTVMGDRREGLSTLRSLVSILPQLQGFDWSGTNIMVLDGFNIDPTLHRLEIPAHFSPDSLITYLRDQQKTLKWPFRAQNDFIPSRLDVKEDITHGLDGLHDPSVETLPPN